MKDPIEQGNEIFNDILKKYPDHILDINQAYLLLKELIKETEGWVIVDFLDAGCWDRLTKVNIDFTKSLVYLIENEADDNGQIAINPQSGSRDGLVLKFKNLKTYSSETLSGIFIRGYVMKKNEIRKTFSVGVSDFAFPPYRARNFAKTFERTYCNVKEFFDVLNSPIYSIAIIPKNTPLASFESQEWLFNINFDECLERLQSRKKQLMLVEEFDEETICEKANTGRRIFELVLKIECSLIEHNISLMGYERTKTTVYKQDYDKLTLGNLQDLLSSYKPSNRFKDLGKISESSNKLSHDSGHLIRKQEALDLFDLMIIYTQELLILIKDRPLMESHYTSKLQKVTYNGLTLKTTKLSDLNFE